MNLQELFRETLAIQEQFQTYNVTSNNVKVNAIVDGVYREVDLVNYSNDSVILVIGEESNA